MEEKSIKQASSMMWGGLKMFLKCALLMWWKSFITSLIDLARFMVKHPVVALLILGVIVWQAVVISNQRVERDQSSVRELKIEQTLDSLQTQADFQQHYIATLKHEQDSTNWGKTTN